MDKLIQIWRENGHLVWIYGLVGPMALFRQRLALTPILRRALWEGTHDPHGVLLGKQGGGLEETEIVHHSSILNQITAYQQRYSQFTSNGKISHRLTFYTCFLLLLKGSVL